MRQAGFGSQKACPTCRILDRSSQFWTWIVDNDVLRSSENVDTLSKENPGHSMCPSNTWSLHMQACCRLHSSCSLTWNKVAHCCTCCTHQKAGVAAMSLLARCHQRCNVESVCRDLLQAKEAYPIPWPKHYLPEGTCNDSSLKGLRSIYQRQGAQVGASPEPFQHTLLLALY
jgi:hypothetical protein